MRVVMQVIQLPYLRPHMLGPGVALGVNLRELLAE